jgi:hypothetical protein
MSKKHYIFFYFLFSLSITFAANPEKYDWDANRSKSKVNSEDLKGASVVLKDKRVIEYIFDESKNLVVYKTLHKIILVNTSEAIEQYNKVYVGIEDANSLINIKARSINKNGKVTLLDKNSFKELDNVENMGAFKIFAIEGLEPGSEIEYIYTVKRGISLFGREFFQSSNTVKNIDLDIISPKHLQFEGKGYNGVPALIDTVKEEKRFLSLHIDSIPAASEEEYSVYQANLQRMDYKLAFNHEGGRGRLLTWANAAESIFNQTCVFNSSEKSKVKKLVKAQKFGSLANDEAKIKGVENYIKSNFLIRKGNSEDFILVDKIISNKYAEEAGVVRLFEAILSELNIDHRLVLTTDRSDVKFDGKFDTWKYLDNYVFFFPSLDKYLAPTQMEMRFGMIPFYWTHNEGLFIKKVKIGDTETSVSEVKFIPALASQFSPDNIYADIQFSDDLESASIKLTKKMGGYNAVNFQPYYTKIEKENLDKLHDQLMHFISQDAEIKNIKVENTDPNKSLIEYPFIISGDLTVTSLIEKAGNKYFFKVGDVIGRQSELYSEKKRVNSVENDFNRVYIRQIKVKIPTGYTFKNLDDIKKNVAYEENGQKTMGFVSSYKVEGDLLIIDIDEYYNKIDFPLSMFEDFRKVINAAADFNKVVLILDKSK